MLSQYLCAHYKTSLKRNKTIHHFSNVAVHGKESCEKNKGRGYTPNPLFNLAGTTRLELATSGVTGHSLPHFHLFSAHFRAFQTLSNPFLKVKVLLKVLL